MQKILVAIILIFSAHITIAQSTVVKGRVYDSLIQKGLAYTTVSSCVQVILR
jgi:hypothetical protein